MADTHLEILIGSLTERLGRIPTEDEVMDFINGDEETRSNIWNQNIKENTNG